MTELWPMVFVPFLGSGKPPHHLLFFKGIMNACVDGDDVSKWKDPGSLSHFLEEGTSDSDMSKKS